MVKVVEVSTPDAPSAIGPYSQAVAVSNSSLLFISGQIPLDPASGKLVDGDIKVQTEQVLVNVEGILKSQGLTTADVVKTTCLLMDIADFGAMNEVYAEHFKEKPFPARAAFSVKNLPKGALIEIEAVAVIK
ncbi:MAG: Rid family detoxifying hydrolase [Candidatus Ancillula sp.]|jgi:2-iminobutanoate/2-iminopropanoate deaminase|nr:Rid family detoxifying hydrolase [Candidatus Ancillula sp.]